MDSLSVLFLGLVLSLETLLVHVFHDFIIVVKVFDLGPVDVLITRCQGLTDLETAFFDRILLWQSFFNLSLWFFSFNLEALGVNVCQNVSHFFEVTISN